MHSEVLGVRTSTQEFEAATIQLIVYSNMDKGIMLSEKGNVKRFPAVFHLCNIHKMTKLQRWGTDWWWPGREGQGWGGVSL